MGRAWATVETLADDQRSGAAEIAERAARTLAEIPPPELPDAIETLLRAHPQMAPLWRLASDMLEHSDQQAAAESFLQKLAAEATHAIGALTPLLPDSLVTISYSSTVKEALHARRPARVVCMSSEPGGEGLLMAGALSAWCEASVVPDGDALAEVPGDAVLVGADAVTPSALVNKVKTSDLAEAARKRDIPCFAVAGETKFVPEELPVSEPFEAAALDLFSGIATSNGLLTPTEAASAAAQVHLHNALRMLVSRL